MKEGNLTEKQRKESDKWGVGGVRRGGEKEGEEG